VKKITIDQQLAILQKDIIDLKAGQTEIKCDSYTRFTRLEESSVLKHL